jgi:hypothetical protein
VCVCGHDTKCAVQTWQNKAYLVVYICALLMRVSMLARSQFPSTCRQIKLLVLFFLQVASAVQKIIPLSCKESSARRSHVCSCFVTAATVWVFMKFGIGVRIKSWLGI